MVRTRQSYRIPAGPGAVGLAITMSIVFLGSLAFAQEKAPTAQGAAVPFDAMEFTPLDPARPAGPAIAILAGDPDTGPSSMLMRLPRFQGRLHFHSHDYECVVVAGRVRHWVDGEKEAAVPDLGPGSYWRQPRLKLHGDSCLSEECLLFLRWDGPRDAHVPQAPE